jgi:hypothetical protein
MDGGYDHTGIRGLAQLDVGHKRIVRRTGRGLY